MSRPDEEMSSDSSQEDAATSNVPSHIRAQVDETSSSDDDIEKTYQQKQQEREHSDSKDDQNESSSEEEKTSSTLMRFVRSVPRSTQFSSTITAALSDSDRISILDSSHFIPLRISVSSSQLWLSWPPVDTGCWKESIKCARSNVTNEWLYGQGWCKQIRLWLWRRLLWLLQQLDHRKPIQEGIDSQEFRPSVCDCEWTNDVCQLLRRPGVVAEAKVCRQRCLLPARLRNRPQVQNHEPWQDAQYVRQDGKCLQLLLEFTPHRCTCLWTQWAIAI